MRPKKVILLVDADESRQGRMRFVLETRGFRVVSAGSSREVLEILELIPAGSFAPPLPDLLLADLLLPGMDANELTRRVKAMHPLLPALIYSGTVASYERALAADAFLPKGANTSAEMIAKVKQLVARKRGPHRVLPTGIQQAQQEAA